jgi:hypothetical protein
MSAKQIDTIAQVIARMRAIEQELPENDGVLWFNRLYLSVTEAVEESVKKGQTADSEFLERLDVVFARLYFKAYDVSKTDKSKVPKAWAPLFESRKRKGIAPIQFALCGMNAHINHDLPLALVATAKEMKLDLRQKSPEHKAYLAVNKILAETEERVKHWFSTGFVGIIDQAFGNTDDVVAIWNVARARDQAWTAAETLESIRLSFVREHFLLALSRMVAFAGRGLVLPIR